MKQTISLVIALAAVAGIIWYIEASKARPAGSSNASSKTINIRPEANSNASSSPAALATVESLAARDKKAGSAPAVEITDPTGFINAAPDFKLSSLIGKKVVLVDFWTYSCINCVRTIPYLNAWYERYRNQGLEIVGVHTPEFDFEKNYQNVQAAVKKYDIRYPVVLDSNYGTWEAYGNRYWPHEYLIDVAGYIVHDHIGEGGYEETEREIQRLLAEQNAVAGTHPEPMPSAAVSIPESAVRAGALSPETYFGAARNEYLANGTPGTLGDQRLNEPRDVRLNHLYLTGDWSFQKEYAAPKTAGATIVYRYKAANVYLVASALNGATIKVLQDGKPVASAAGNVPAVGNIGPLCPE